MRFALPFPRRLRFCSSAAAAAAVLLAFASLTAATGCGRTDLTEDLLTPGANTDGGETPDGTVPLPDGKVPPRHDAFSLPDVHLEDRYRLVEDHRIDVPGNDTGTCGNGNCDNGETCTTCPDDCGFCQTCGDGMCDDGETCSSCELDCGPCATCPDGFCDHGETCTTCPEDCGQCPTCGDGNCGANENCENCPQDCGKCKGCPTGDCTGTETCISCPEDCGSCAFCGNGVCETSAGETCDSCPQDCGACPVAQTCAMILACAEAGIMTDIASMDYGAALTALSDCDANACTQAQGFAAAAVNCIIEQFLPPNGMCGFGGGGGGGFTCALTACAIPIEECMSQAPCPGSG